MFEVLKHLNHSVGQNSFHLVWKPKYCWDPFKFLPVKNCCEAAIRNVCGRYGIDILELEVMSDHIHCFVDLHPSMSVSVALQLLKGFSSKKLFEHFPWLRRYFRKGHLWSPGKFFRSVGNVTAEAIKNYIAQSNRNAMQQPFKTRYSAL